MTSETTDETTADTASVLPHVHFARDHSVDSYAGVGATATPAAAAHHHHHHHRHPAPSASAARLAQQINATRPLRDLFAAAADTQKDAQWPAGATMGSAAASAAAAAAATAADNAMGEDDAAAAQPQQQMELLLSEAAAAAASAASAAAATASAGVVPARFSTALERLRRHPEPEKEPELAHGLAFRAAFRQGRLVLPAYAGVAGVGGGGADPGTLSCVPLDAEPAAASAAGASVDAAAAAAAANPLSSLAAYCRQDADGRVRFALASTPANPRVPSQLLTTAAEDLAAAYASEAGAAGGAAAALATPADVRPEALAALGARHAAVTLRLVAALWGNDPADDAAAPSTPPTEMGEEDCGSGGGGGIPEAYEEVHRRRLLERWLTDTARVESGGGEASPAALAASGRRLEAAQEARRRGGAVEAALLLASRHSPRVQGLLARAEHRHLAASLAPPREAENPWKAGLHGRATLADLNEEPGLRAIVRGHLAANACPPPQYEALSRVAVAPQAVRGALLDDALHRGGAVRDVCCHLLNLWGGACLEEATSELCNPLTWGHSYRDYSLNWLVCLLLSEAPNAGFAVQRDRLSALAVAYAEQLCSLGRWRWAVFVLLTIEDAELRRARVTSVLTRHLAELGQQQAAAAAAAATGAGGFAPADRVGWVSLDLQQGAADVAVPVEWVDADAPALVVPDPVRPERPAQPPMPLTSYLDLGSKAFLAY